jgi:hypothetical protein
MPRELEANPAIDAVATGSGSGARHGIHRSI